KLLKEAIGPLSGLANFRKVKIECPSPGSELFIRGHEELIKQAMMNLIENAINYSDSGETVHIQIKGTVKEASLRGRNRVSISIRSRGLQIPPEERDKIFDRNFRSDKA